MCAALHSSPVGLLHPLAFLRSPPVNEPCSFCGALALRQAHHCIELTERFLKLDGRTVKTRPIKGAIARSGDAKEDQSRAEFLQNSEKDRAETS